MHKKTYSSFSSSCHKKRHVKGKAYIGTLQHIFDWSKEQYIFFGMLLLGSMLSFLANARADFTFSTPEVQLQQNTQTLLTTNPTGITGTHPVSVSLTNTEAGGDGIFIYDDGGNQTLLTEANSPLLLFTAHNFDTTPSISINVEPVPKKYGRGTLVVSANGETGSISFDTRFSETININTGQEYGTDAYGGLLDFIAGNGIGVSLTPTHLTGMIWSENFGWIDLQPEGGGVTTNVLSSGNIELNGTAWNEQIGWINFGKTDGAGGVFIDGSGYFQGTAWSENFGYLSFGEYMSLDPLPDHTGTFTPQESQWAQTSWKPENLHIPTIQVISPDDNSNITERKPAFVFHIEDEDGWNKVGFDIRITKQNLQEGWGSYLYYKEDPTLSPNLAGENYSHTFTEPLEPGVYRWEMRALDENGLWSEPSPYRTLTVGNSPPVVTLTAPDDGSTITGGRRPTFTFDISDPDNDYVQYTVQIATDNGFTNILGQSSSESSLFPSGSFSYTPVSDLPGGTLYWRVVAKDGYGRTPDTTPIRSFIIQNTTPSIQNVSLRDDVNAEILDGESTQDITPTLQWESIDPDSIFVNTTIKVFQQGENPDTATPTWDNGGSPFTHTLTVQNRTLGPLPTGDYFYRIQTCDTDNACSQWAQGDFTVDARSRFGNVGTVAIKSMYPGAMVGPSTGHSGPVPTVLDDDSSDNKYAWSESVGWIDMNPVGGGVIVENNRLRGYAWNDTVGWIRMSCEAFDGEASAGYECDTHNYGVTNLNGELAGTALIESTGKYIYFSGVSFGDGTNTSIDVDISCDPNYEGHFLGKAWSPDIGWISFGRQELYDDLLASGKTNEESANTSADLFGMTEWSCGAGNGPVLEDINKYVLFSAQEEDFSFAIARKNTAPFSSDVECSSNDGTQGTAVRIEKINPDGTVESGVTLSDGNNFSVGCLNKEGQQDGKIWLTLHGDALNNPITKTPGLYRIIGDVADTGGATTSFPTTGTLEEQYIIQVVAGAPDLSQDTPGTKTIEFTLDNNDTPIADGVDTISINAQLFDAFGNQVKSVYKYEDSNEQLIKTAEIRSIFWDDVLLDQVEGKSSIKEAAEFTAPLGTKDIHASTYSDEGHPTYHFYDTSLTPSLQIDVTSLAPSTSGTNRLLFRTLRARVEQQDIPGYTGPRNTDNSIPVGQTTNPVNGNWTEINPTNPRLQFFQIFTADIENFEDFANAFLNIETSFPITLTNQSKNKDIYFYDWIGIARNIVNGNMVGPFYTDITLKDNPSELAQTPPHDYWQEVSSGGIFAKENASEFPSSIEKYIGASRVESMTGGKRILADKTTYPTFDTLDSEQNIRFYFSATPVKDPNEDLLDGRISQFVQFIALVIDGKIVKFPLQSYASFGTSDSIKLSISGSIYGKEINEQVLVSENESLNDYNEVNDIYTRQKIREIIYSNYKSITGLLTPKQNIQSNGVEIAAFDDYSDLVAGRNLDDGRWIHNGSVAWFKRTSPDAPLSIVLGTNTRKDGSGLPEDTSDAQDTTFFLDDLSSSAKDDPITLMIEGGNLYIKDNIKIGNKRNLGVIVLSSRENASTGKEGNIFIDPSVTSIEGLFYADGSVMSAKDLNGDGNISENEIYDGFEGVGMSASDLSNQLYIKGSVTSMNTAGTLSFDENSQTYNLPKDVWLPEECTPFESCTDKNDQMKAAMRYDFSYLRRFGLNNKYDEEDHDFDTIKNSMDCDWYMSEGQSMPSSCQPVSDGGPIINTECETYDAFTGTTSLKPEAKEICQPKITGKQGTGGGQCAPGTYWCQCQKTSSSDTSCSCPDGSSSCTSGVNTSSPFIVDCGADANDACDLSGYLNNKRIGAATIIDYDPLIHKITPVGMELPPSLDFSK